MSETTIRSRLSNAQQAAAALQSAYKRIKPFLLADWAFDLSIKPATRTSGQNDRFHAICSDIAKSCLQWGGKCRTPAQWKVLLVSAHAVATGEGAEMVPGIEGEFVNLRESTALMSIKRGSSLIEYATAFAVSNGVTLRDPRVEEQYEAHHA